MSMPEDTVEFMFSASVIPARSVDRIRRAIAEGRDPEPYLKDAEEGLAQIRALYDEFRQRVECETCGHVTYRTADGSMAR